MKIYAYKEVIENKDSKTEIVHAFSTTKTVYISKKVKIFEDVNEFLKFASGLKIIYDIDGVEQDIKPNKK